MKKIIKYILVIFIINIYLNIHISSASAVSFSDVKTTTWYYDELVILFNKNIIAGFPDGTFKGSNTLTKDQYINLLVTAINENKEYGSDSTYWFKPYMNYAKELGIISVLGIRKDFNVNISREEVSYLADKVLEIGNVHGVDSMSPTEVRQIESKIIDYADISDEYKTAVYNLYYKGILNGFSDGTFKPKETLTRAQAVIVISNIMDYRTELANKNYIDFQKVPGYVMESVIDDNSMYEKFKVTEGTYGNNRSDEITNILD